MTNGKRKRRFFENLVNRIKADAVKEFVARLDKKVMCGTTCSGCVEVVEWSDVVDVMKETVGE